MANTSKGSSRDSGHPAKGGAAMDSTKTKQEAEATLAERKAKTRKAEASSVGDEAVKPGNDSPKPHGDKLSHAAREQAKR